ncbi:hypothetical protein [Crossiella sp. CA198]|uniref:hypothetical protein n=1 Tax=Crossiella sp. CA198 TaxID=3455607 RepID=UPI003F8D6944
MMQHSVAQQDGMATREDLLAAARKVVELFVPDTIAEMLEEIQRRPRNPVVPSQATAVD